MPFYTYDTLDYYIDENGVSDFIDDNGVTDLIADAPSGGVIVVSDDLYDNGISELVDHCDRLTLCSQSPTDYTDANSTHRLGHFDGTIFGAITDGSTADSRKTSLTAISNGTVDVAGTASHFAALDTAGSRVLLSGPVVDGKVLNMGTPFAVASFDVEMQAS